MPKKSRSNQLKNPKQYEAMRKQGMSKEKAVRISNAGRKASVKGGKRPKYEEWTYRELLDKAREVGIEKYYLLRKKELIHTLRNN